jgi:transposase-like protein
MNIDLTDAKFHDENAAREWFELSRWPNGVTCVHCGGVRVARMGGTSGRPGLFHCPDCRGQFTVRTGHIMESSKVPLTKWAIAFHMLTNSKKGMSAHQLHRTIKVAYNTAWFMEHRIREAMRDTDPALLGGEGKIVEADETYHGKRETPRVPSAQRKGRPFTKSGKGGGAEKRSIVALVERGGKARAQHMNTITAKNMSEFLALNADTKSRLHTDESKLYPALGTAFAAHETVNHAAKEYARGDVTTNSVEGFFGIFKRGFNGIYQHCGEQHLQRYLDEYSFRYSNRSKLGIEDARRAVIATQGGEGKRLTWRRTNGA